MRYEMKQKLISIGDDYYIKNDQGERIFKVDGKLLRLRKTLNVEDMDGNVLCKIQSKILPIRETIAIENNQGQTLARIKKAIISPFGDRMVVNIPGGKDYHVKGDILAHSYEISSGMSTIAEVSKKWFTLTDTYGVEVADGQNDALVLAITIALDLLSHSDEDHQENREKREERQERRDN